MRVLLLLIAVAVGAAWAGYAVRRRDPIAAVLLYLIAGLAVAGLVASFLGWPGGGAGS
jgi:type VI protein secretion system component VasF